MKELYIYSASWCQPCKMLKKTLEDTVLDDTSVVYVDIDKNPTEAQAAGVRGVPTLILMEDGVRTKTSTGYKNSSQLQEFVESSK